jgi:hypothetical protein
MQAIRSLPALAVLLLALPMFAAKTNSATSTFTQPITIGATQLKPGTYTFQAADGSSEIEILQGGKVIGKAACHWVKLPSKADESEVESEAGKVTEISFRGNDQAVRID